MLSWCARMNVPAFKNASSLISLILPAGCHQYLPFQLRAPQTTVSHLQSPFATHLSRRKL